MGCFCAVPEEFYCEVLLLDESKLTLTTQQQGIKLHIYLVIRNFQLQCIERAWGDKSPMALNSELRKHSVPSWKVKLLGNGNVLCYIVCTPTPVRMSAVFGSVLDNINLIVRQSGYCQKTKNRFLQEYEVIVWGKEHPTTVEHCERGSQSSKDGQISLYSWKIVKEIAAGPAKQHTGKLGTTPMLTPNAHLVAFCDLLVVGCDAFKIGEEESLLPFANSYKVQYYKYKNVFSENTRSSGHSGEEPDAVQSSHFTYVGWNFWSSSVSSVVLLFFGILFSYESEDQTQGLEQA
ncbi:hypothetical protein STEG23_017161 [Scotinomys teguina]